MAGPVPAVALASTPTGSFRICDISSASRDVPSSPGVAAPPYGTTISMR
jgi:hypothetical protein